MTAKRRLIPMREVKEALATLSECGIDVTACTIDIREDGLSISPIARDPLDEYEAWTAANPG